MKNACVLLLIPTLSYRARAFVAAAGFLDLEIVVGSERTQALAELLPGTSLTFDLSNPEAAVKRIVDASRDKPFNAIVGVDEETVVIASMASERLSLPHNPVSSVQATRDKYLMRQRFSAGGLLSPKTRLYTTDQNPNDVSEEVAYPCVLKPTFLSASRGVIRADNEHDFEKAFHRISNLLSDYRVTGQGGAAARQILVEDYIPGVEVALEGILPDGKLKLLALFDKPDPLEGPTFTETIYVTPSRLAKELQDEIVDTTKNALKAIGIERGPVHAELRINASGIYVIEIAARSIGGYCSEVLRFDDRITQRGRSNGFSLEELILRNAIGEDIRPLERESQSAGVMMVPAPQAGILKEAKGVEVARKIPGIENIIIAVPVGQKVEVLPESSRYLGFIFARGENPEFVEEAIRAAHEKLEIVIT
jgi:biotin carboxylase